MLIFDLWWHHLNQWSIRRGCTCFRGSSWHCPGNLPGVAISIPRNEWGILESQTLESPPSGTHSWQELDCGPGTEERENLGPRRFHWARRTHQHQGQQHLALQGESGASWLSYWIARGGFLLPAAGNTPPIHGPSKHRIRLFLIKYTMYTDKEKGPVD